MGTDGDHSGHRHHLCLERLVCYGTHWPTKSAIPRDTAFIGYSLQGLGIGRRSYATLLGSGRGMLLGSCAACAHNESLW